MYYEPLNKKEKILFGIMLFICTLIIIYIFTRNSEGGDLDDYLKKSLIGVWKELHHQDCLDGESIVIYYPHMRFEEFTTYIANEDCEFVNDGSVLMAGEDVHKVINGTWDIVDGYLHFTTDLGKQVTNLKITSIGTKQARFQWENGNILRGYKIGGIIQ